MGFVSVRRFRSQVFLIMQNFIIFEKSQKIDFYCIFFFGFLYWFYIIYGVFEKQNMKIFYFLKYAKAQIFLPFSEIRKK